MPQTMKSFLQHSGSVLCPFPAINFSISLTLWFRRRSSLKSLAYTLTSCSTASKNSPSLAPSGTTYGCIQQRIKTREPLRSLKMPTIVRLSIKERVRRRLRQREQQFMTSSKASVDNLPSSWTSLGSLSGACKHSVFQTRLSRSFTRRSSLAIADKTMVLKIKQIRSTNEKMIRPRAVNNSQLQTRVKSKWSRRLKNDRLSLTSTVDSGASGALTMLFVAVWDRRKRETISYSTTPRPNSKRKWIYWKSWRSLGSINSPPWQVWSLTNATWSTSSRITRFWTRTKRMRCLWCITRVKVLIISKMLKKPSMLETKPWTIFIGQLENCIQSKTLLTTKSSRELLQPKNNAI